MPNSLPAAMAAAAGFAGLLDDDIFCQSRASLCIIHMPISPIAANRASRMKCMCAFTAAAITSTRNPINANLMTNDIGLLYYENPTDPQSNAAVILLYVYMRGWFFYFCYFFFFFLSKLNRLNPDCDAVDACAILLYYVVVRKN